MTFSIAKAGFTYLVEHFVDNEIDPDTGLAVRLGRRIHVEKTPNRMPLEGIHHMEAVTMLEAAQVAAWYLGLYGNDYAPQANDVMATFPALAGEVTTYENATRHLLVNGNPVAGVISNAANRTEVVASVDVVVRGGFIASAPSKGATSGVLLSAVRFASPRDMKAGDVLRVTAGLQISS